MLADTTTSNLERGLLFFSQRLVHSQATPVLDRRHSRIRGLGDSRVGRTRMHDEGRPSLLPPCTLPVGYPLQE